jgi:hypothetical protein
VIWLGVGLLFGCAGTFVGPMAYSEWTYRVTPRRRQHAEQRRGAESQRAIVVSSEQQIRQLQHLGRHLLWDEARAGGRRHGGQR